MSDNYLNINNLSFEYPDGHEALKNINLNLLTLCYIRFSAGYFTDRSTLLYVNELVKHEFGDEKNIEYLEEFISNHVSLGLNGIGIIICLLNSYTEKF